MTAEKDVVDFLVEHNFLQHAHFAIEVAQHQNPRFTVTTPYYLSKSAIRNL